MVLIARLACGIIVGLPQLDDQAPKKKAQGVEQERKEDPRLGQLKKPGRFTITLSSPHDATSSRIVVRATIKNVGSEGFFWDSKFRYPLHWRCWPDDQPRNDLHTIFRTTSAGGDFDTSEFRKDLVFVGPGQSVSKEWNFARDKIELIGVGQGHRTSGQTVFVVEPTRWELSRPLSAKRLTFSLTYRGDKGEDNWPILVADERGLKSFGLPVENVKSNNLVVSIKQEPK